MSYFYSLTLEARFKKYLQTCLLSPNILLTFYIFVFKNIAIYIFSISKNRLYNLYKLICSSFSFFFTSVNSFLWFINQVYLLARYSIYILSKSLSVIWDIKTINSSGNFLIFPTLMLLLDLEYFKLLWIFSGFYLVLKFLMLVKNLDTLIIFILLAYLIF